MLFDKHASGLDAVFDTLVRAGLRPSESAGYHGHALTLGSADVTLLDLTNAYRMLASGGRYRPVRWTAQADPGLHSGAGARASVGALNAAPSQVFDPAVAYIVGDILADPAARATTFGLDSPLVTRRAATVRVGPG